MKTLETISNCTNTNKERYLLDTMWCREVIWVLEALSFAVESVWGGRERRGAGAVRFVGNQDSYFFAVLLLSCNVVFVSVLWPPCLPKSASLNCWY